MINMDTALLIARLLLALVFFVAGLAKLADRKGSSQALIDFGVPAALASPLSTLLPLAELAVAIVLIPTDTAWWGALGALARNGLLAVLSGLVVWLGWEGDAGQSALSWLWALSGAQLVALLGGLVLVGLVGGQWWCMAHLLRQNGRLLVRLEALEAMLGTGGEAPSQNGAQRAAGLPVGTQAPSFSLPGLHGETITLEALRAPSKPVMLLFTDPDCGPCTALLP